MDQQTKKEIQIMIDSTLKSSFSRKRVGDTPTDALQLTPKKYVNLNGVLSNRPASIMAVVGQQYFATDVGTNGTPIFYNGTKWVNSASSIIASN